MSTRAPIKLSIVTVCWNDLENVRRTMASLEQQNATCGWEHLLIDGASSDGTVDWYRSAAFSFPHRVLCEPDKGIFDAMNKSLGMARGEYIVFMNAGDRYGDADAVSRILRRIESRPVWGYGRAKFVDELGLKTRPLVGRIPYSRTMHLLGGPKICHQAVVMRTDFIRELGCFDLSIGNAADYHLLVKAASIVPPVTWDDIDVEYLAGGISAIENHEQLWRRHRARVDALSLNPIGAGLDKAWTALQLLRVHTTKRLKPLIGPLYLRLLRR